MNRKIISRQDTAHYILFRRQDHWSSPSLSIHPPVFCSWFSWWSGMEPFVLFRDLDLINHYWLPLFLLNQGSRLSKNSLLIHPSIHLFCPMDEILNLRQLNGREKFHKWCLLMDESCSLLLLLFLLRVEFLVWFNQPNKKRDEERSNLLLDDWNG